MNSTPDIDLFKKVKKDDLISYEIIFKKYYQEIFRFAFNYLRDKETAEEIAQEVFLYIWEKRKKIEIQTTLKTYLYSATKNKCLNYLRLELPKLQATSDVEDIQLVVSNNIHSDEGERERLKKYVDKAIDNLPKKCRHIFVLSRNAGMTYEEIAQELDLSKKTVENQMGIALKKLRESLALVYEKYKELNRIN